jgi:hypothetical protein
MSSGAELISTFASKKTVTTSVAKVSLEFRTFFASDAHSSLQLSLKRSNMTTAQKVEFIDKHGRREVHAAA